MRNFDWRSLLRFQGGSLLMILCGGILMFCPDSASVLISAVLGWLLIAAGVALVILGLLGGVELVTIIQGAGLLVVGSWLHRHPLMIASALGIVLGLVALSQGWRKAKQASRTKLYGGFRIWDGVVAAAELLVGLVLIFTPLSLSRLVMTLAGLFVVICGTVDVLGSWQNGGYQDGSDNIIDAE